jgi:V/A-type H+/Na+-transporting ATPase subunit F
MELAIIGTDEFCLGFRLTGIKKVYVTDELMGPAQEVMKDQSVGVVVLDHQLFKGLDDFQKKVLEDSSRPVFIALSTEAADDDLKKMIKKSIGVEL